MILKLNLIDDLKFCWVKSYDLIDSSVFFVWDNSIGT